VLRELHGQRDGEGERLVVSLSNAVPYSAYFNEPLGVLHIRFERTEPATGTTLEGDLFRYATVVGDRSATELRIGLDADAQYSLHAVPNGNGYQLAVNLFRKSESRQPLPSWRVVLDPGLPAGGDPALPLARAVAQELRERGLEVHLSRADASVPTLPGRAASGNGADLFLSFSISPAGNEDYSLYYLGEAQSRELLERAIRLNAADALPDTSDRLRRQILLGLVPDLVAGRRLADELQGQLYSRPEWQGGGVHEAPLRVLAGAGGRGVLLELTAAAAADPGLPALLATGIQNALRGR
jgi:N-acetylmuramoyl-L-alanine amidase